MMGRKILAAVVATALVAVVAAGWLYWKVDHFGDTPARPGTKETVDFVPNYDESLTEPAVLPAIRRLKAMGFELLATSGTSEFLNRHRVANRRINKVREGRPHVVDAIKNGDIDLIINTPSGRRPRADEAAIRINAVAHGIPLVTTATAAEAVVEGIAALRAGVPTARPIQEYIAGRWQGSRPAGAGRPPE